MSGQVILFRRAKEDGFVEVVSVLVSSDTELAAEARRAVRLMRCEPMKVNAKPVDWDLVFTVDFRLKK
jgi:TonB family protein